MAAGEGVRKMKVRRRIVGAFTLGLLAVGVFLMLGLAIPTNEAMPGFANIYRDDQSRTYLAQPCVHEWKDRPGSGIVRFSHAMRAWSLGYEPDQKCRESGALIGADSSLTRDTLVAVGILAPPRQWWDTTAHPVMEIVRSNSE
jgi:hypothetical protein